MNTFFAVTPPEPGEYDLGEDAAHHARVKRLEPGDAVRVTDGQGRVRDGTIVSVGKNRLTASLGEPRLLRQELPVHLYVPIADRDRTLWLAEKAAELEVSSWTPVLFHRSKSVNPRAEGDAFHRKLQARMIAAVEQSGGAWLPDIHHAVEPYHLRIPDGDSGYVLDPNGPPMAGQRGLQETVVYLVVGPEGGFEPEEFEMLRAFGWKAVSIGTTTLRFETAAVAALAIAKASRLPVVTRRANG